MQFKEPKYQDLGDIFQSQFHDPGMQRVQNSGIKNNGVKNSHLWHYIY